LVKTAGAVACSDFDPDFLKQRGGQYPPCADNDRIVGQIDFGAFLIKHNVVWFDFLDSRFKQHGQAPRCPRLFGQ
jgi:hypothetical protein